MSRPPRSLTLSIPMRAPTWVSTRRLLEENLQDLHKNTNLNHVKQLHAQLIKNDLHTDLYVAPKLISAFSLCNQITLAVNVFSQVHDPNVHLYNTLIRAHVSNSQPHLAFDAFLTMQRNGLYADNFTYPFLLKACSGENWLPVVKMIHGCVEKFDFFNDLFVPNALIDSYCKCGGLGMKLGFRFFMGMVERDVVSWNSMINGLVRVGELSRARELFDEMPVRDLVSWNCLLDGLVKAGDMDRAFDLFEAMPERNVVSWSTMVFGYCKTGDMGMAQMLFDKMPVKNLVSWTVIVSGFAERGMLNEAMRLFNRMEVAGVKPDAATLISVLAACAESGLIGLGKRVHASTKRNAIKCSINVSNALIDMYAKCGGMKKALDIFNEMPKRDLVSWNCLLHGLALHGHGTKALKLFSRMKEEGLKPDKVTFVSILCACTHAGLVEEGMQFFNVMEKEYGIVPHIEHYGCMIDLLGRYGHLKEAFRLVQSMPMEPNVIIWGTLLGACRMHNAVGLVKEIKDHLVKLEPSDPGNYTMLSNIFAAAGDWSSAANMRLQLRSSGIQKPSGASSIELGNEVRDFTVFDKSHPHSDRIYQIMNDIYQDLKQVDQVPNIPV